MAEHTEAQLAQRLGVSLEAVQAVRSSDLIDLHIDTFIPMRLWRYDIEKRHDHHPLRGRFAGHLDLPRMEDAGLSGAMWSVTTNPARPARNRWKTTVANFRRLRQVIDRTGGRVRVASTFTEWQAARRAGAHAALLVIQGGNALDAAPEDQLLPDPALCRVTLVHLTNSQLGESSQPRQLVPRAGLTNRGRNLVRALNRERVFVDLAHISERGFWDAVEVHDRSQPLLVTHTGVEAMTPHWRNIDDDQIRAIADTGGTIGIMFHTPFLRRAGHPVDASTVVDHMQHVIEVAGEDHVSVGSDYDGAIVPPPDLRSGDAYPRLVQVMLDRGWSATRIEKVLGGNFARAFRALRP